VNPSFIDKAVSTIHNAGGEVCFVKLDCPVDVIEERLEDPSRARFFKLNSVAIFRDLREKDAYHFPDLPPGLTIDTSTIQPNEAARRICEHFQIPVLPAPPVVEHYPKA
jgi:chloramphenicol 3-O-phosphotransferase